MKTLDIDLFNERISEDGETVVTLEGKVVPFDQFSTSGKFLWVEPSELLAEIRHFISYPKQHSAIHVYWDGTFYQLNYGYLKI